MQQQFFVRDKTGKLAGSKLSVKMSGSEYQLMEDGKESSNSERPKDKDKNNSCPTDTLDIESTTSPRVSPRASILKKQTTHGNLNSHAETNSLEVGQAIDRQRESRVTFSGEESDNTESCERDSVARDAARDLNTQQPLPGSQQLQTLEEVTEGDMTDLLLTPTANSRGTGGSVSKRPRKVPPPLQKLKSRLDLEELGKNETELKANLYFHIGNPIKRWKIERVIPIKLILQLIKTICLVVQVSLFTTTIPHQRGVFFYDSREVFENHFLPNMDTESPRGIYTAFSTTEIFRTLEHICLSYYDIANITIGGYDYQTFPNNGTPVPVTIILRQYTKVDLDASTFSYVLDGTLKKVTFTVAQGQNATEEYINASDDQLFNRFFDLVIKLPIHNVRIVHASLAECLFFMVTITFRSEHDSGKVSYYLREKIEQRTCNATSVISKSLDIRRGFLTFLDILLIIMSLLSIFLIFSTLKRAVKLSRAMGAFYKDQLQIKLSLWERRSLFTGWHFLNFFSDIIVILGTTHKIALNFNYVLDASLTRVCLGTAVLLQAGVVLRYVSYFKELNALNRTLYLAFPELLKFMLCAGLLFLAFGLTGYIVLGPFHPKFVNFYETIETLFGLLNGDDIYATFDQIDSDDNIIAYVYSRIFLYSFLILFIYFVLNLFTSLVISAYEASQHIDNSTKNEVRRFVFSGPLTPNGVALRDVTLTKKYVDPQVILRRRHKEPGTRHLKRTHSIVDSLATAA